MVDGAEIGQEDKTPIGLDSSNLNGWRRRCSFRRNPEAIDSGLLLGNIHWDDQNNPRQAKIICYSFAYWVESTFYEIQILWLSNAHLRCDCTRPVGCVQVPQKPKNCMMYDCARRSLDRLSTTNFAKFSGPPFEEDQTERLQDKWSWYLRSW